MSNLAYEEQIFEPLSEQKVPVASVCSFLTRLDIQDIVEYVDRKYYSDKKWHYRFRIEAMIKLIVVMHFRKYSYEKAIFSLTESDIWDLGFVNSQGQVILPSPSTLHYFVKYRLGVIGIKEVMEMIGKKISVLLKPGIATTDSTPMDASRYDARAKFNPHYNMKMYKAHITMIGEFPLFMTFTEGDAHDSPELSNHIMTLRKMEPKLHEYCLDSGYDSFENHADIWYHLSVIPHIKVKDNAVVNKEGSLKRIDHWVNKMWKKGGDIHASLDKKLWFLYEHDRSKQVGMYFRNLGINNPNFDKVYRKRSKCEAIHAHIKDTVTFNVRGIRFRSKELYALVNFISYQLLLLTNIQNNVNPVNAFRFYF